MEQKVTVKEIRELNDRNGYKTQTIVTQIEGDYPVLLAVEIHNEKVKVPEVGSVITAHLNIKSREYNGRFYHDIKMWRCEVLEAAPGTNDNKPFEPPF